MSYTADATNVNTPADTDDAQYAAAELRAIKVVQVNHTSRLGTNETNISNNTSAISALQSRVTTDETNISNVTTTANAAMPKSDLASNLAGKGASLVGLQDSGGYFPTKTAEAALQQLASQQNTDKNNISTNTTNITTNTNDITSLKNSRTTDENNISTLQSQMTTANSNITSLQNSRTTDESNISTLQNQMSTANTDITNLQNKQTSDEAFLVPQYGVLMWWKAAIPSGWAICDGTNGTPDLRGKFLLGVSSTHALGATGGEETHILTINEMPSHSHTIGELINGGSAGTNVNVVGGGSTYNTNSVGGGAEHNNMPPYYALYFIMKL